MEYLTILLSVVAVFIAYGYYLRRWKFFARYGIPHLPPQPIVGNMGPMVKLQCTMMDLVKNVYHVHPDAKYVGFYDFGEPMLFIRDLDLIKDITLKSYDHFHDHQKLFDVKVDTFLGEGLFFQNGDYWKTQRSLLTPLFTSSKMKNMFKMMAECAERYVDHMCQLPESEREIDIKALLFKYGNDVIASCVFGIEVDTINEPNNELYKYGSRAKLFVGLGQFVKLMLFKHAPVLTRLFGIKFMMTDIERFFKNLIAGTVKARQENGIYRPDLLQLMMEAKTRDGATLTIHSLSANAFGFYFGACENISLLSSFVLHLLAQHPDAQARVQEELDGILKKNGGQITYESLTEMEYLEAVIYETQRLYNMVLFLDRLCTESYELPPAVPGAKPFTLKPGMLVWIPICAIHTDPKYYEDPDKFDPERFVNDGKRIMASGAFMPFGTGPRHCIGARFATTMVKVLLSHILARCNVVFGTKSHVSLDLVKGSIFVVPEHGFWLKVEPRKNISTDCVSEKLDS